jgi:hypothetical protein
MIPAFILWLLRRYLRASNKPSAVRLFLKKLKKQIFRVATVLLLTIFIFSSCGHSQKRSLNYKILRNGTRVGTLRFTESTSGNISYLQMESDVKTRFIISFTAHAEEQAVYSNGILQRSSIYRKLNGSEKANKQHSAENNRYIIRAGQTAEVSKIYPITYNMLSLYSKEPVNIGVVYSDNFETPLRIEKTAMHTYKIKFPDNNYNYYSYQDGVLNEIEIHHSFYSANIVLTQ